MDYKTLYKCVDCGTTRYLVFPNRNESLIICSGCYRERNLLLKENKFSFKCSNFYCPIP